MAITLRPYQEEAINKIWFELKYNQKVGVVMPTGSGKSIVETEIIDRHLESLGFQECILVLSHITDVSMQLYDVYKKFGKHPGACALMHGDHMPGFSSKIVFSTMQTTSKGERIKKWRDKVITRHPTLVLIDEAHLFGTRSYEIICNQFFPRAKILGFSATPFRENKFSFSQFEIVAYSIDIETLVSQGFLTPPKLVEIKFDSEDESEKLHNCLEIWKQKEKERGLVTVIYLPTTEQAREWNNVFAMHCKSRFIDGKTARDRITSIYNQARAGEIDVIVNCKKLETGIDIPNIGAIFMPFPLKSVTSYLQRVGRAVRLFPGKTTANIYVYGSTPSISRGKWKRIHHFMTKVHRDPDLPGSKLQEELDWLLMQDNPDNSKIAWTQTQIEAVEKLASRKMFDVAKLLEYKRFPRKFARAINFLVENMREPQQVEAKVTGAQRFTLYGFGFTGEAVDQLGKWEAQSLISAINSYMLRDPWIVPVGPHQGKHISETPSLYRARIKDKRVKKLFYDWIANGRPDPI
jgi:superfamily II DNA or RNA helicase